MDLFDDGNITDKELRGKCVLLSNDIKAGKSTLLQIIESLQSLLTHEEVDQRERGLLVVITILKELNTISSNELEIICKFLLQKLKDHHKVLPVVIEGIKVIVEKDTIPEKLSITILSAIFENIPCQQQQQADRYNIYCIFKRLLEIKENELKSVGLDLVYGLISSIDSERDPRNLLFLFDWLPTFIQKIELGHLTEEMFEILSCYFPVDFRPTSNESITREALAKALSKCLCAKSSFAEHTIPLALEKLDSELLTAKLDSLDLLIDGSQLFSPDYYIKHSTDIWSLIQKHILTLKDDDLVAKSLTALTAFVKKITDSEPNEYGPILSNIIDNLKGNLTPDAKLFGITCRILINFASASEKSSEKISKLIIPLLSNLLNITSNTMERAAILAILTDLTVICFKNSNNKENLKTVPEFCLKLILEGETELKIASLRNLSKLSRYITKETRDLFYTSLKTLLLSSELLENLRTSLLDCLAIFSKTYPEEIENLLINMQNVDGNSLRSYLEAIGRVIETKELWNVGFKQLIHYSLQTKETSVISLKILREILEKNIDIDLDMYLITNENIIDKLIDSFLTNRIENDLNTLDHILTIIYRIIAKLSEDEQNKVLNRNLAKLQSLNTQEVIVVWCGLLFGLRKPYIDPNFTKDLINIAFNIKNAYINEKTSELLGNIVNKLEDISDILCIIHDKSTEVLSKGSKPENTIVILTFVTKGLVLRGHPDSTSWIEMLLELSYKYDVARSFEIIISDKYQTLSTLCHCQERVLHKQKFFSTVLTFIEEKSKSEDNNFLMIVAYLAYAVPKQILYMNFSKIIKWLILCINSCTDVELLANLIKTINNVIENKEGKVENYISEILNCYTNVALKNKSMKIRILTLRGVQLLSNYPTHKIIPLKEDVMQSLAVCLDDPKRLVRKEAVETRLKWYFIDAPM